MRKGGVVLLVTVLLGASCCLLSTLTAGIAFLVSWPQVRTWEEPALPVDVPLTLHIRNPVGRIVIRGGQADRVRIRVRAEFKGWPPAAVRAALAGVHMRIRREGHDLWLEPEMPSTAGLRSRRVRLDITVPRQTSLDIQQDVGQIRAEGLAGTVALQTSVGQVIVDQVTLTGDSRIVTDVGEVSFLGALPARGEVHIRTNVGAITVHLQSPPPFHLLAQTGVGTVTFTDAHGARTARHRLELDVGSHPATRLLLETGTGAITVFVLP